MNAQDVQLVLDVQGILADNGVDAADIKPELIATLIDWKKGDQPAPAPAPPAPAPVSKGAKTSSKAEVPDDEPF